MSDTIRLYTSDDTQNFYWNENMLNIQHGPYFFQTLTDKKYPNQPLEYLEQPQPRPQSQVWPEEIERIHETKLVHWGQLEIFKPENKSSIWADQKKI